MHVDASLVRADVSWESLVARHNADSASDEGDELTISQRNTKQTGRCKKVSTSAPDATMADKGRKRRLESTYKQRRWSLGTC